MREGYLNITTLAIHYGRPINRKQLRMENLDNNIRWEAILNVVTTMGQSLLPANQKQLFMKNWTIYVWWEAILKCHNLGQSLWAGQS